MIKKKRWAIGIVLVLAVSVPLVTWLRREIQIDKCLDAGGAWDYEQLHCIFEAPHK